MTHTYVPRIMDASLSDALAAVPAVLLAGAKGVGKTSTAARLACTVERMDDPLVRQRAEAALGRMLDAPPPVLFDEWQRVPTVWDAVRRRVDDGASPGRFLLTGSAHPRHTAIHSGAGRIVTLRMRPQSLAERWRDTPAVRIFDALGGHVTVSGQTHIGLADYVEEIVASGFPGIRRLSRTGRTLQLDGYIENVINREFAEQGAFVRAPDTLRRWLTAYAAAAGTTASYAKILDAATPGEGAKPARSTVIGYRDVLSSLWLLDEVPAWVPDGEALGRLAQTPKHFLVDPALAARLLDADADDLLDAHVDADRVVRLVASGTGMVLGRLFEHLVAQSLLVYADAIGARLHHLRTRNGDHEVDFIITRKRAVVACEVKLSASVTDEDVRHLHWLQNRIGGRLTDAFVITMGSEAYRRRDGIGVVPAALLGP